MKKLFIHVEVCFSVNYNFIFVIPEYILRIPEYMKVISSNVFQVLVLNIFFKNATICSSRNNSIMFMI